MDGLRRWQAGESIREVVAGHMGAQGMSTSLHQLGCSGDKEAASGAGLSALLASLQTQDAPQVSPVGCCLYSLISVLCRAL